MEGCVGRDVGVVGGGWVDGREGERGGGYRFESGGAGLGQTTIASLDPRQTTRLPIRPIVLVGGWGTFQLVFFFFNPSFPLPNQLLVPLPIYPSKDMARFDLGFLFLLFSFSTHPCLAFYVSLSLPKPSSVDSGYIDVLSLLFTGLRAPS